MTKNQEWKQSGSKLSFKEWLRNDLNKDVNSVVENLHFSGYMNADGNGSNIPASCNYKPTITGNTVLGVNKYIVYGLAGAIILTIGLAVWHKSKK